MEDEVTTIDLDRTYSGGSLSDYRPVTHDESIDLTVSREQPLDRAIGILRESGYVIKNIKPKSGRLEEFFVRHTNHT